MVTFGYELEEEFNAVTQFINDKYGIIIKSKEQLVNFTQKALTFMMTIKVWKKHLMPFFHQVPKTEMYFQEMLSNAVHIIQVVMQLMKKYLQNYLKKRWMIIQGLLVVLMN